MLTLSSIMCSIFQSWWVSLEDYCLFLNNGLIHCLLWNYIHYVATLTILTVLKHHDLSKWLTDENLNDCSHLLLPSQTIQDLCDVVKWDERWVFKVYGYNFQLKMWQQSSTNFSFYLHNFTKDDSLFYIFISSLYSLNLQFHLYSWRKHCTVTHCNIQMANTTIDSCVLRSLLKIHK